MKKIVACVISVLIFVFLCTSCSKAPTEVPSSVEYSVFAEEVYVDGKVYNVQSVIEEILAGYDMVPTYQAQIKHGGYEDICKNIRIYSDRYYIGYWASDDFLDVLPSLNENGSPSDLFSSLKTIKVPVFATVGGEERIVSSISIYYHYDKKCFNYNEYLLTELDNSKSFFMMNC